MLIQKMPARKRPRREGVNYRTVRRRCLDLERLLDRPRLPDRLSEVQEGAHSSHGASSVSLPERKRFRLSCRSSALASEPVASVWGLSLTLSAWGGGAVSLTPVVERAELGVAAAISVDGDGGAPPCL